jgi:hypothetical protein
MEPIASYLIRQDMTRLARSALPGAPVDADVTPRTRVRRVRMVAVLARLRAAGGIARDMFGSDKPRSSRAVGVEP